MAAKFTTLKTYRLQFSNVLGDLGQVERDDKAHWGWNIYHYAVYGYQINCSYLLESPDIPPEILNEQVREGGGGGGGGDYGHLHLYLYVMKLFERANGYDNRRNND